MALNPPSAVAQTASSQTESWTAPASGYVYDSRTQSIRTVSGYVGAAVLGNSVADGMTWASIAPNQNYALGRRGGSTLWIPDLATAGQSQVLDQFSSIHSIFWASDSSRAVILSRDQQLIWLNGFGASPAVEVTARLDVPARGVTSVDQEGIESSKSEAAAGTNTWRLLAADTQADKVLLSSGSTGVRQLWLASRSIAPRRIELPGPLSADPAAAVFTSNGLTAFVADASAHRILRIGTLDGVPAVTPVPASEAYVDSPAGLLLSTDDSRLFVPSRNAHTIRILDAGKGDLISELPLDASPISVTSFSAGRFLLNSAGSTSDPFLFLDTAEPARVSFVPRGE